MNCWAALPKAGKPPICKMLIVYWLRLHKAHFGSHPSRQGDHAIKKPHLAHAPRVKHAPPFLGLESTSCGNITLHLGRWRNGRRNGLKIRRGDSCGFESHPTYSLTQ